MKQKPSPPVNILFCGIGGQGVLAASEICAIAAMLAGYHVRKSEVKGMSQRGGSVDSHVRFGKKVYSPLIPRGEADFLVPFNAEEGAPLRVFLKKGGLDLSPLLTRTETAIADKRFVNTYMLGALSAFLPIDAGHWTNAIARVFKRANEENRDAFIQGFNQGKEYDIQRKV